MADSPKVDFPYTHFFLNSTTAVTISGPHIQTFDASTGKLIASTVGREGLAPFGPIRVAAVDRDAKHLITAADDKMLKLWRVDALELVNERELPKRPTALNFTQDGQTIVVADKFGDVFSYPLEHVPQNPPAAPAEETKNASHENPSGGRLILGHVSLLNAFVLSADEKYILTADRDEHIRVSWYPQGYTIESYCLGHTSFVSALHVPDSSPDLLISGGGDPVLKVWDWLSGRLKRDIAIREVVVPYIKVKPAKRTPWRLGTDGAEGSGSKGKGRKKGKKGKGKGKQQEEEEHPESTPAEEVEESAPVAEQPSEDETPVLAISQIKSWGTHVVFSAFGATALFSFALPKLDSTPPDIHIVEFGQPVLGFTIQDDGLVWACLDNGWEGSSGTKVWLSRLDADGKVYYTLHDLHALTDQSSLLN
ncbi:tRNA (guanine-N(7)-)-methyltransferase non-catalytic subunit TRM82 [Mycena chlorophos]|uniref:tRNA (Guanine-N(7)-)-methyltransferase non-catalytic subunit TRM82 n=1 Tax=Mycena chlorophos TaxID=658473 RepID=A0A8H6T003_MYCCL|nr:tRNA (guanine-N(7)-)-methyltransferase non-catalytic subunit TRM82 [Mycena chlorophos]